MKHAHLLLLTLAVSLPACGVTVGEPSEDAVAGDGLGADEETAENDPLAARVCAEGTTTKGVDVSYYQGTINWSRVKAAGYEFAFIRLSDGARFRDPKFATNWTNAGAAGVIRGAYQFFRPAQNIAAQAQMMIDAIGTYTPGDMPPVIDVEATSGLSPSTVATRVRQWVDLVEAGLGVRPIVYTGKYFWRDEVGGDTSHADHPLWIAQYTSQCPDIPAPWTTWTFWQHTDRGVVPGIPERVDLNKFNGSVSDLVAYTYGN